MAEIVVAIGASHTGLMIRKFRAAPREQRERIMEGFAQLRTLLGQAAPDVLVIAGSDHLKTFFFDNMPTFCLGVGEWCEGWGDAGVPQYRVRVHHALARTLLAGALDAGFDLAFSYEMPLDHGFFGSLHFLTPEMDVPIVPLFVNSAVPPQPSFSRCHQLGEFLGRFIRSLDDDLRVAILGTGGLSHWVGVPGMGRINESFDRWVLDLMCRGRAEELIRMSGEELERRAGNGAHEIRNWLIALGALGSGHVRLCVYEPIRAWATGIALLALTPSE
ncbi:MAG: extradiol dioxygenase [Acidobacteria bacterium]|nr:MAG: extradiol dioxygenase [Acidobacteriota bacterium]